MLAVHVAGKYETKDLQKLNVDQIVVDQVQVLYFSIKKQTAIQLEVSMACVWRSNSLYKTQEYTISFSVLSPHFHP